MLKTVSSVVVFFLGLLVLQWLGLMPKWLVWFHALLSLCSFFLFAWHKLMAVKQRRRVAESTLLLSSLIGGWPGSWFACQVFRHKTQKKAFIQTLWGCTLLHLLTLVLLVVYQLGLL